MNYCRYLDICAGLVVLISVFSLEYGAINSRRGPLELFFILSFATVALYWGGFFYFKYVIKESEANKEVRIFNHNYLIEIRLRLNSFKLSI